MVDLAAGFTSALRERVRWARLADNVPVMLVHPDPEPSRPVPTVLWMHGRTVTKEIDPGRYLRMLRAGLGVCAVDLPGHGERYDETLQDPHRTLDIVLQMVDEIDPLVDALRDEDGFDADTLAIGGMSAGGMATLMRLCRAHDFRCASVEATSGAWQHQRHRRMFRHLDEADIARHDPMAHLDAWREIPLQALHARHDEWVAYEGQVEFLDALRARASDPALIELVTFERTGAPYEHAGFGKMSAVAKDAQRDFLGRWLLGGGD